MILLHLLHENPKKYRRIYSRCKRHAGMTYQQAVDADELFIAVTTKDIVPVVKFDDKIIGSGKPGKLTLNLMKKFKACTAKEGIRY